GCRRHQRIPRSHEVTQSRRLPWGAVERGVATQETLGAHPGEATPAQPPHPPLRLAQRFPEEQPRCPTTTAGCYRLEGDRRQCEEGPAYARRNYPADHRLCRVGPGSPAAVCCRFGPREKCSDSLQAPVSKGLASATGLPSFHDTFAFAPLGCAGRKV